MCWTVNSILELCTFVVVPTHSPYLFIKKNKKKKTAEAMSQVHKGKRNKINPRIKLYGYLYW